MLIHAGYEAADTILATTFDLAILFRFLVHTHEETSATAFLVPSRI